MDSNTDLIDEVIVVELTTEDLSRMPFQEILVFIKRNRENWDLGKFPHVIKKLELMWGEPEIKPLLESLLDDTRSAEGGSFRQGFPLSVLTDLQSLIDIHTERWPDIKLTPGIAFTCG